MKERTECAMHMGRLTAIVAMAADQGRSAVQTRAFMRMSVVYLDSIGFQHARRKARADGITQYLCLAHAAVAPPRRNHLVTYVS